MAKYIVLDNKFTPMSFADRIAPYKDYYENAYKQLEALSDLEATAAAVETIAKTNPQWLDIYNTYMQNISDVGSRIDTIGVDGDVLRDARNAKTLYYKKLLPMVTADGQSRALNKTLNDELTKDSTVVTNLEGIDTSPLALYENPTLDLYQKISGKQVYSNVATKIATKKEEMNNPSMTLNVNDSMYNLVKNTSGYSYNDMLYLTTAIDTAIDEGILNMDLQEAMNYIASNNIDLALFLFVADELENSGVLKWQNSESTKKVLGYIINGLWEGVGKTSYDFIANREPKSTDKSTDGGGTQATIYMNNPTKFWVGSDMKGYNNKESEMEDFMSPNNPLYQNAKILYRDVDINGDITLLNGRKMSFMEVFKEGQSVENKLKYFSANLLESKGLDNYASFIKFATPTLTYHSVGRVVRTVEHVPSTEEKVRYLNGIFNTSLEEKDVSGLSDESMYEMALIKASDAKLSESEKTLKKYILDIKTLQTESNIRVLELSKMLPEKVINAIVNEENVHKAIEGWLGFFGETYQSIPVSLINDTNNGITESLRGNVNGVVYKLDGATGLERFEDVKGVTVQEMLKNMPKDKDGHPMYTVYLNPATLFYDNYNIDGYNNHLLKDSFIVLFTNNDETHRYVVNAELLGSAYIAIMKQAQKLHDLAYWQSSKPTDSTDVQKLSVDDNFYTVMLNSAAQVRPIQDINNKTAH